MGRADPDHQRDCEGGGAHDPHAALRPLHALHPITPRGPSCASWPATTAPGRVPPRVGCHHPLSLPPQAPQAISRPVHPLASPASTHTHARKPLPPALVRPFTAMFCRSLLRSSALRVSMAHAARVGPARPSRVHLFTPRFLATRAPEPGNQKPKGEAQAEAGGADADVPPEQDEQGAKEGGDNTSNNQELEKQAAKAKDDLLRVMADMENVRRIAKKDVESARTYASQKFAKQLLDVADNLSR